MQHLPTLVFRGEDQQLATEALIRSQRLLANPSEAELWIDLDAVDFLRLDLDMEETSPTRNLRRP